MRRCELLILAALRMEADALARALDLPRTWPLIYTPKISLALIGPKAAQLAAVTEGIEPGALLLAGLGGALDPALETGDVVIASPEAPQRIHGSATLVATPDAKRMLFRATGALAVDMETAPVRALAAARGIPCTVIRAISDTAAEALDPAVLGLVDPHGNTRTSKALALLARHPAKVAMLMRLNRASKRALEKLAAAVVNHVRTR